MPFKQRRKRWVWGGVGIVGLIMAGLVVRTYNQLVNLEEDVRTAWAQVQVQYQRRADLIPALVEVVQQYAQHERVVLLGVTEARARAGQIALQQSIRLEEVQQFLKAQDALSQALHRLLIVAERYPELKANQRFAELQAQLEGTENRIAFARNRYNEAVQAYNTYARRFFNQLIARLWGFEPYVYFDASAAAQQSPTVEF